MRFLHMIFVLLLLHDFIYKINFLLLPQVGLWISLLISLVYFILAYAMLTSFLQREARWFPKKTSMVLRGQLLFLFLFQCSLKASFTSGYIWILVYWMPVQMHFCPVLQKMPFSQGEQSRCKQYQLFLKDVTTFWTKYFKCERSCFYIYQPIHFTSLGHILIHYQICAQVVCIVFMINSCIIIHLVVGT